MPHHALDVDVLNPHTIDVELVFVGEARNQFGVAALGAMSFIDKRLDNGDAPA
jgi:hypothetical protein